MSTNSPSPESFLPLRPVEFEVLLSLGRQSTHGYAILIDAEARSGERFELGTLYRALRRMEAQGLIQRVDAPAGAESEDERRRYYALTALGRSVASAETRRMEGLVRLARNLRLAEGQGAG